MSFHVVIQPRPAGDLTQRQILHLGDPIRVLELDTMQGFVPFRVSFDQAEAYFSGLSRMFFELDGSFVWVIETDGRRYQLDGIISDDGNHLLSVELKGMCSAAILDRFLRGIGWPDTPLVFQFVQPGFFVSEEEFRRAAEIT